MEDIDRSCVYAVIAAGLVFALLTYIIYPAGIWDVPFSDLTSGRVLRLTGAVILGVLTLLIFIDVINVFRKR